jgi:hypothetical protein
MINTRILLPFCVCVLLLSHTVSGQEEVAVPRVLSAGDSLYIKELYLKGLQQKSSGQIAAAERIFQEVVQLQPDNDAAFFELARIRFDKEDFVAAAEAAGRAVRFNPDNEWYWSMLLEIYKRTGNVKAMPAVLTELIRLQPDKASHYQDKAYALFLNRDYEASLAVFDTIAARFGEKDEQFLTKHEIYKAQGDTSAAIRELETLVSKKPGSSNAYLLLAALYTETGEMRKALELLDEAAGLFAGDPLILLGKSDTYLAMGKQKQAYECLQQAFLSDKLDIDAKAGVLYTAAGDRKHPIAAKSLTGLADLFVEKYPGEVKAHAVRGDIYMQLQQLEQARTAYLNAIGVNRYIEGVWQQLLQVELQMGRFDDVQQHGKEALALFPKHTLMLFFTGHGFLGNSEYEEARTYLEAALNTANEDQTPLLTQLYSSLGDVYNALDMHAESDVAYEEAIALDSTNAYALNNYAYYLALRKQKLAKAAELARRSNELVPDNASYQDTYAWVLFQQGKHNEALVWIEKALKNSVEPSDTLMEHYGDILAKLGRPDQAVAQWKKARAVAGPLGKNIDKLSKKINERQYID